MYTRVALVQSMNEWFTEGYLQEIFRDGENLPPLYKMVTVILHSTHTTSDMGVLSGKQYH